MIIFNKLTKAFKKKPPLFTDFSYSFDETGFYKVTGPSGSGKSVLMKLMLGLLKPTSGQVIIDKIDITKLRTTSRETYVFNKIYYNPASQLMSASLTVRENLQLISDNPRALEYLTAFEQESKIDQVYSSLSGGERKIVALIGTLIAEQETIVLDEPLSSISREYKKIAFDFIKEMSLTKLVIMISHDDDLNDSQFLDIIDFNSLKSQEIVNCETIKYKKQKNKTKFKLINSYFFKRLKQCWVQNLLASFIMIFVSTLFFFSYPSVNTNDQNQMGIMTSKFLPDDSLYNAINFKFLPEKFDEFMSDPNIHQKKICFASYWKRKGTIICGDDSKFTKAELEGNIDIAVISNNLDSFDDSILICMKKTNGSCLGEQLRGDINEYDLGPVIVRTIDYQYDDILKTTKNPTPLQKKTLEDLVNFKIAFVPEDYLYQCFVKEEFLNDSTKELNESNIKSPEFLACIFENRDLQYVDDTYGVKIITPSSLSVNAMDLIPIIVEYTEDVGPLFLFVGIMAYLTYVVISNLFVKKSLHMDQLSFRNHGVKRKSILWTFDLLDLINFAFILLVSFSSLLLLTPICNAVFSNLAFGNELYFAFVGFSPIAFMIVVAFLIIFDLSLRVLINHHVEFFTKEK